MTETRVISISAQGAERVSSLGELVTPDVADRARADTNAWIKRLRLVPYGGVSMRERFRYRDDSLWWFTELYLQKMRQLDQAVLTVLALDSAQAQYAPARLAISGADAATAAAARAFGAARGIPVDLRGGAPAPPHLFGPGAQVGVTAALSRARLAFGRKGPAVSTAGSPMGHRVAAFVHTAFWRGNEGYIGPILDALTLSAPGALQLVGVGPQRNFTLRRWWDPVAPQRVIAGSPITPVERLAPWTALRDSLALWRGRSELAAALVSGEAIREAAHIHGCDLWPVLEPELRGAALVQWPWSARAMDEAGAAIDALQCDTVVTYAEAGGWGRALILEARRRGVASAGVQHGFIYRHWLNYLHEPDEMEPLGADRGFPAPTKTLLFDRYAEAHLRTAGAFAADRLAVTGSPGRDALVARVASFTAAEREAARVEAGVARYKQKLAVLAAKFTEVRNVLPALIAAVQQSPDIHLAIKAHPAESSDVYAPAAEGVPNVTILGAETDLARLLAAADVVVTRNSTVAIDALVIRRHGDHTMEDLGGDSGRLPALVIGQPSNLNPLVNDGVMLAADDEAGIRGSLERLLYDREVRAQLGAAADAFVERFELKARGSAAARAAGVILEMKPGGARK